MPLYQRHPAMQLRPYVQAERDWMLTYASGPAEDAHVAEWMKIDRKNRRRNFSERPIKYIREEMED
jgi:hypothetical protein